MIIAGGKYTGMNNDIELTAEEIIRIYTCPNIEAIKFRDEFLQGIHIEIVGEEIISNIDLELPNE